MGSGISVANIPIPIEGMNVNASTISFPTKGIKLSYIHEFYTICGGREAIKELTTTDINEIHQKKITEPHKLSLCDYLSYLNHPAVGEATVFISHAWKYKFVDVMDALEYYFQDNLDVIIWFDLFSNNQHLDLDFQSWCGTFKSAIGNFKYTVMVLCPWNNPIPLTRAWCIWELYCTIITNSTFAIALSQQNQMEFLNDILEKGATEKINEMLATIDTENSACFKEEDQLNIFEIVRKEVGFNTINAMIFLKMRNWVIETTESFMNNEKNQIRKLQIMNELGILFNIQGKYDRAEPLFIECLEKRKVVLDDNHPDTLTSMNNLATLYTQQIRQQQQQQQQQQYEKAEQLYIDCIEKRKTILGQHHRETIAVVNNLAALYDNEGKYDKAESLYKNSLEISNSLRCTSNLDTLSIMNNLNSLYIDEGNYEKINSCENVFEEHQKVLGDNHLNTITSMENLARLYTSLGKFQEAEILYIKCFNKRKEILGDEHPDTIKSNIYLTNIYKIQGKYDLLENYNTNDHNNNNNNVDKDLHLKPKEMKRRRAVIDFHILNRNNTSKSESDIAVIPQP